MKPTVFISYSRQDKKWKNRLEEHLKVLVKVDAFDLWVDDKNIKTGDLWRKKIHLGLNQAAAGIFLISRHSLTSDFIKEVEFQRLLDRRESHGVRIFPVIVSPCAWKKVDWICKFQAFNAEDDRELSALTDHERNKLLSELTVEIAELLNTGSTSAPVTIPSRTGETVLLTRRPKKSEFFIGRDSILQDLDRLMEKEEPVVLINGMGGIGKTEVCRHWFRRHYRDFRFAGWVDYVDSLRQSFFTSFNFPVPASDTQTMDERYAEIISFLETKPDQVLLVVDNIENPDDKDLDDLIDLHISVLASSRQTLDGFTPKDLDQLNMESCKRLFYRYYGQNQTKETDPDVEAVIELCGYHTLTVELLARTARNAAQPVKWLRDKLKDHGIQLDPAHSASIRTRWQDKKERKALKEHLGIVFDLSGLDENELNILINLSILPSMDLAINDIRQWLDLPSNDPIITLTEKGWLKRKANSIFMHQVIAEVVRQKHPPDLKNCGKLVEALYWKLKVEPTDNPIDKKPFVVLGESVAMRLEAYQDKALATLANNLSLRYQDLGQLEKALEFQKKASDIYEAVLDKNHPLVATSCNNLCTIYYALGQLDKALEFQKKDTEIREKVLDKNHPSLATSYNNLSMIYKDLGQLKKALEFQKKATDISEAVLDKNHPDLATYYNNKCTIYYALGQLEKALEFQKKSSDIYEAVLDKNHPLVATSYNNLSMIYKDLGQLEKALEFQKKDIEIREKVLDKNHSDLATSYNNLSLIYQDFGQLQKTLEFQKKAIEILEVTLDKNHPNLVGSYNNLSLIYKHLGQLGKALEFQKKVVEIREEVLDENHPDLAISYHYLSIIYLNLEKYNDSLDYSRRALAIFETLFPNGHPNLDVMKDNLEGIKKMMIDE